MRGRIRWARITVIACLVALLFPIADLQTPHAGAAVSGRETIVTIAAERNEYVTGGRTQVNTSSEEVSAGHYRFQGLHVLDVVVHDDFGGYFTLYFVPPPGEPLEEGVYANAVAKPADELGRRPGIEIVHDDRRCDQVARGHFEIKKIVRRREDVRKLWMTYAQQCGPDAPWMFGEIRYQMAVDDPSVVAPDRLRWPAIPLGGVRPIAPVELTNDGDTPLTIQSVDQSGSPIFFIRHDECVGQTLAPEAACRVWIHASGATSGLHRGSLTFNGPGGVLATTTLRADVAGEGGTAPTPAATGASIGGGPSFFTFESEPGDPVGEGQSHSLDGSRKDVDIYVVGSHHSVIVHMQTLQPGVDDMNLMFVPPFGEILAPGLKFEDAQRPEWVWDDGEDSHYAEEIPRFLSPDAGLLVTSRPHQNCEIVAGSFEVHALRVAEYPYLEEFSASFVQRCDNAPGLLRGRIDYRRS